MTSPLALLVTLALLAPAPRAAREETRLGKLARLVSLEDRRSGGDELLRYLRDPDRGVRYRAAVAAGRIGEPLAVPPLVELMNDSDSEIRQAAAFALGLIGDRSAGDRLAAALADQEPAVRGRAAEALSRIGDAARAGNVAGMILAALPKDAPLVTVRGDDAASAEDPWLELRLGLLALARFKDSALAESVLLAGGRPRFDWWAATWTAAQIATPNLRPLLVAAASSSDPASRALAARGLGALKDHSAVDLLVKLSQEREPTVVIEALSALAAVPDPRGTAAAAAALASTDLAVRREALLALARLPPDRGLRPRVLTSLADESPFLRAAAIEALAHLDRQDFMLVLSSLDPDPDWTVRAGLARALTEIGDESGVSLLFGMLKDPDPRLLPAVLGALRVLRGGDAVPTLQQQLSHPDLGVRAAAAEGLAALPAAGLGDALLAAYRQSLADSDPAARLSLVKALAHQKDAPARRALVEIAAQDPLRAVRQAAVAALGSSASAPPAPERSLRAPLDDRFVMLPFEPQAGRPLYTPRALLHTRKGRIEVHLNVIDTPLATESFIALARRGFYDGLGFHRVVAGSLVEAGCPRGDGNGGPGYTLRSERNRQPFGRGTLGLALAAADTGGSRFFITLAPAPELDGEYPAFGRVVSGMEIVDQIRPGDVIERIEIWDGR